LTTSPAPGRKPFEVFRRSDYRDYGEPGLQEIVDPSPTMAAALGQFVRDGGEAGQKVQMAYARPGMSLTHVWFKSGYPLPLHSHSGDCLYYIVAGSIRVGRDELGPGDGFFVSSDVPYTYETGPNGAEVLEFRATDKMDIRFIARDQASWTKTVDKLRERGPAWASEPRPSEARHD